MYLHNDDPFCKKLALRTSCSHRGIKRRTISLVGFSLVTLLLTTERLRVLIPVEAAPSVLKLSWMSGLAC